MLELICFKKLHYCCVFNSALLSSYNLHSSINEITQVCLPPLRHLYNTNNIETNKHWQFSLPPILKYWNLKNIRYWTFAYLFDIVYKQENRLCWYSNSRTYLRKAVFKCANQKLCMISGVMAICYQVLIRCADICVIYTGCII